MPASAPAALWHHPSRSAPTPARFPGVQIAYMLAVPGSPAARRAEPGVLTARHERGSALLTAPGLSHLSILPPDGCGAHPAVTGHSEGVRAESRLMTRVIPPDAQGRTRRCRSASSA